MKKNNSVKEQLGSRIRELRIYKNLSQEKFALQIGMDRTYLASVEKGKRNISLENIYKISLGLEISLDKLFKDIY
ncbi:MAG: helix-turn-helix transcriptional regulator [Oscillospiraceae bacterium]|nr:helix-turn-helix transcriptional regulator [Oscillospiraceae bacterium]